MGRPSPGSAPATPFRASPKTCPPGEGTRQWSIEGFPLFARPLRVEVDLGGDGAAGAPPRNAAGCTHQRQHGAVLGQHVGGEVGDADLTRSAAEQPEQPSSQPTTVPLVRHRDGEVRRCSVVAVADEPRHADDRVPALRRRCDQGFPIDMVDFGERAHQRVGEGPHAGEEAPVPRCSLSCSNARRSSMASPGSIGRIETGPPDRISIGQAAGALIRTSSSTPGSLQGRRR